MNGIGEFWENLVEKSHQMINDMPTHMDADGFLHCDKCGQAVQMYVRPKDSKGIEHPFLVGCTCKCIQERNAELDRKAKEQKRTASISSNQHQCFEDSKMQSWCFGSADRSRIIEVAKRYCGVFDNCREDGFGIFFSGNVGTGKTFAAACIANDLLTKGFKVRMTSFATIMGKIQEDFSRRNEIIQEMVSYDLLIIDDFTAERNTDYANEQIFSVIDGRYRAKRPMIFTANVSYKEYMQPSETMKKRIFSRIAERCRYYEAKGADRRKLNIQNYDGIFNF